MTPGRQTFETLLERTLAIDIETSRGTPAVRHIGACLNGETFEWSGGTPLEKALLELDVFGRDACHLLGHNVFNHDLPILRAAAPEARFAGLPAIDTLYLSPLAFPRNPYHRLVKDYKLVRSCLSDPLEDVRLALSIFADQWESFVHQAAGCPELIAFYAACFRESRFNGFSGRGLAEVFDLIGGAPVIDDESAARQVFLRLSGQAVCTTWAQDLFASGRGRAASPAAAYSLAWLRVAGANSVLPPWIRHQFPEVTPWLKALRDVPCGSRDCAYCQSVHDPDVQLRRFFGFDAFRAAPMTADGRSLQRCVVLEGMQDKPLLAILPTGGGKSLCYQLPALVRHLRRGLLTVVISPLQALMKDQVDNLVRNTGTPFAAAIYGLLTPPERGEVLERVRLGDVAILYISPEQLRSRSVRQVLGQREIGCWVFDEAHCLSKWGHDFRPDYLYAGRFIRELCGEQHLEIPPVACFTATAKPDVLEEITSYFDAELKQILTVHEGGVQRDNLDFLVLPANSADKLEQTFSLVRQHVGPAFESTAIVYAATRKTTEAISDFLNRKGVPAQAFHAGLEAHEKRRIIEAFVAGEIPVICATNAFGMGIDKSDIRLVLHYDLPGSMENYLQEAGRAGRDLRPATCILLYDAADAEAQFRLSAFSEIKKEEIQKIWKSLRGCKRGKNNEIVITVQELLREESAADLFQKHERDSDTKVRTAVSWLERADFLARNQNLTQVFQGKPLVKNIEAAEPILMRLNLPEHKQQTWRGILRILFNTPADVGLSADDIAEQLFPAREKLEELEQRTGLTPAQVVIYAMHEMATAGLLDKGILLSAHLRCKGKKSAPAQLAFVSALEHHLLKLLQEEAPDAETGQWLELDLNRLNQRLNNDGLESNPVTLRLLIKGLAQDGRGLAASCGSLDLRHVGRNRYRVALQRPWPAVLDTAALRRGVAERIVQVLVEKAVKALPEEHKGTTGEVFVEFAAEELVLAIEHDLLLHARVQKPLAAVDRGLMFLHEHKIITLQQGLAVFRQAMTIRLKSGDRRRYSVGDYKPLSVHYQQRRFQIHVIVEYANLALEKIASALRFMLDYFAMPRMRFNRKYFAGREKMLERATSMEAYRRIVESLDNPIQIGIVGDSVRASQLVLAGPGSGKTRIVVHRCAYLLCVERIPASRILVLCFNHGAAAALRRRLNDLVGADARGVMVATYHGAAMRLAGISIRELMQAQAAEAFDFDGLIKSAVALLKGEKEIPGLEPDEIRDHLLQGFSHILVDEYQDIDQDQYELVSAIAGRTQEEADGRPSIIAVGDDDQNIYAFRGANVEYIKRFQQDYGGSTIFMVENYRSSAQIIAAANRLIAGNRDRMKTDHPIRIDKRRMDQPQGGDWERRDPVARGRVQCLIVRDSRHQAAAVLGEMQRLRSLQPEPDWRGFAILSRTRNSLDAMRALLEEENIPFKRNLTVGLPLHRVREIHVFLEELQTIENEIGKASRLTEMLPFARNHARATPWSDMLADMCAVYREETADAELPVSYLIDWLFEALAEQRREKTIGQGVFLSTLHGAKGLEFDHVAILDGDWRRPKTRMEQEEERRLLYVGMTRARQTLCLLEIENNGNPFLRDLDGEDIVKRKMPALGDADVRGLWKRYEICSLSQLYLSHAGRFPADHPIHEQLANLDAGDKLHLHADSSGIALHTPDGIAVARLSREGNQKWSSRIEAIVEARVVAMLRWTADDDKKEFRHNLRVRHWEIPLIELTLDIERLAAAGAPEYKQI